MTPLITALAGFGFMLAAARFFGAAGRDNDPDLSLSSALCGWAASFAAMGLFIITGVFL